MCIEPPAAHHLALETGSRLSVDLQNIFFILLSRIMTVYKTSSIMYNIKQWQQQQQVRHELVFLFSVWLQD